MLLTSLTLMVTSSHNHVHQISNRMVFKCPILPEDPSIVMLFVYNIFVLFLYCFPDLVSFSFYYYVMIEEISMGSTMIDLFSPLCPFYFERLPLLFLSIVSLYEYFVFSDTVEEDGRSFYLPGLMTPLIAYIVL